MFSRAQVAAPGRRAIGMTFNVQHLGHVSADNIEALLTAAKDEPTLLPSFLAWEDKVKENSAEKEPLDDTNITKVDSSNSIKDLATGRGPGMPLGTVIEGSDNSSVPAPRPRPTPRPRSFVEMKPETKYGISDDPAAHAPPVVKPKPTRNECHTDSQKAARTAANINAPPIAPVRRRRLPPTRPRRVEGDWEQTSSEINDTMTADNYACANQSDSVQNIATPMSVPNLPQVFSSEINDTMTADNYACANQSDSLQNIATPVGTNSRANKAGPPPVPPRVDLE